uniref:Uncharacterized protein n=1 Tax=Acrobeloides nanus TaxID=290746 RepID=A0A914DYS8_9BILA
MVVGLQGDSPSQTFLWSFLLILGPLSIIWAIIPNYSGLIITSVIVGSFMGYYGIKTGFSDLTWLTIPMILLSLFIFVRSILYVCYSKSRKDHQSVAEDESTRERERTLLSLSRVLHDDKAIIKWDPSTKTLIVV